MSPNDLYAMTPQKVSYATDDLFGCYYNHVPEVVEDIASKLRFKEFPQDPARLEIRYVQHHDFDFCRFWRLATVWFDGKPVMVLQNAGREGDDWARRIVTDGALYKEMLAYIWTFAMLELKKDASAVSVAVVDPAADYKNIESFYGYGLNGI